MARSLVLIILALALAISVVSFTVAAAWALVTDHLTLSDAQTALVSTLVGGLLGALSTYLGVSHWTGDGGGEPPGPG